MYIGCGRDRYFRPDMTCYRDFNSSESGLNMKLPPTRQHFIGKQLVGRRLNLAWNDYYVGQN